MNTVQSRETVLSTFTLFASFGTLLCCALPATLVALGAGAAVAGLVSAVPQVVLLSEHKTAVFAVAGAMIALAAAVRYANRNAPCPADPAQARACLRARHFARGTLIAATAIYGMGFAAAFLLG